MWIEQIRFQINYCSSPQSIEMYYKDFNSDEEDIFEFNNETMKIDKSINKSPIKLRFESNEDFIFSYSFIDKTDIKFNNNQKWNEERIELKDLSIKEIIKKYPNEKKSNIFSLKFYPNYKSSSTRYIIVIGPKNNDNSNITFSNPCFITKLVTEKKEGIKILEIVDTGENDDISLDVDFSDISGETNEFILNIISQELRFEKKLNFYIPYEFHYEKEEEDDVDEDDNEDKFPLLYIVLISVGGLLIIIIIIFFIIRHCKKKNTIDFKQETKTLKNEKLLKDM